MTLTQTFAGGLGAEALSRDPNLIVTWVEVFLYRDACPRPAEHFLPENVHHNPDSPYHFQSALISGKLFQLYTDQYSLQGDDPLRFHTLACTLTCKPFGVILFRKTGGGGRGSEADERTVRELFAALRSFPVGWEEYIRDMPFENEEGASHAPQNPA